ncbi:MAG: PP2C family protein-serine/threonine phosphatase, partial [Ignavibacterium sp.]
TIFDANDFLLKYSQQKKENNQMTTTLDILYLKDNFAYWGHIGDSRIYHLRGNNLRLLTKDHTLIQKLIEEGYLTLKQASNHPSSHIILKALGKENPEPDLSKMRLSDMEMHRFFLCSDGVTSLISDIELNQILSSKDFDSIQNNIISLVRSRGAADDYSFILVEKANNGRKENS